MNEVIIVDNVEYVTEKINGRTVLVKKEDAVEVTLTLSQEQAEALHTILHVVGKTDFDLCYSDVIWFADYTMTFKADATRLAEEIAGMKEFKVLNSEDSDYSYMDNYMTAVQLS